MKMTFTRRQWLVSAALLSSVGWIGRKQGYRYLLANRTESLASLPADYFVPFGWAAVQVPRNGKALLLKWTPEMISVGELTCLRITSATDGREECTLSAHSAQTNTPLGELDVRYAIYMQPFELQIAAENIQKVLNEGIALRQIKGEMPFCIFTASAVGNQAPTAFLPHILASDKRVTTHSDAWKERLLSLESLQTFGWMHGCVLDGIMEMSSYSAQAKAALQRHIAMFFAGNELKYAAYRNQPRVNELSGVESLLPFAILARTNPEHPALLLVIDFCKEHQNAKQVIADGEGNRPLKTEECYTVSYPLAVMARVFNRPELADWAVQTIVARVELLHTQEAIYQRANERGDSRIYGNWGRGVAWYLLGIAKTITHLSPGKDRTTLIEQLNIAASQVIDRQQPNGLWHCFFDQPETDYETSGTAGIAAALAYAFQQGYLDRKALVAAQKAKKALASYLTPDGFLTGSAQANKGGVSLQTEGFRIIAPYTLGFLAHLEKI